MFILRIFAFRTESALLIVAVASTLRPTNLNASCLRNLPNICRSYKVVWLFVCLFGMGYAPEWHFAQMKCMAENLSIFGGQTNNFIIKLFTMHVLPSVRLSSELQQSSVELCVTATK